MSQQTRNKPYKKTLNLPRTRFSMKANLLQNEPASRKQWSQQDLYGQLRQRSRGRPPFMFHDGPPYANGSIHLGHLLNKVLKDFVVRSRSMLGYDCPFVPGWDCHGLPIEHKVLQELGDQARDMSAIEIRRKCRKYAEKYQKVQAQQMQRLLTLGDYDNPYLTMDPAYEQRVLEVFADLVQRGLVYRGLKPVHWSIDNQTALADAELEYHQREDVSIYTLFPVNDRAVLPTKLNAPDAPVHLMIWTTTPWTLPANLAVAVAPRAAYGLYHYKKPDENGHLIIADDLAEKVLTAGGAEHFERLGGCTGRELTDAGLHYRHPFIDRTSPLVPADFVTLDDGTGLVHIAPGHGQEDYALGMEQGLSVYCPVRDEGTFDETAPDWLQGKSVWQANDAVVSHLRNAGLMYHDHLFSHSYPHDWRGKTPVIFRATAQWFVAVDQALATSQGRETPLRDQAIGATENVAFYPRWGKNRMQSMLQTRPDWCLSRQRAWGLPIPAFYPPEGGEGEPLLTSASIAAVAKLVGEKGSDVWFQAEPRDLLQHYEVQNDPDAPEWARTELQKPEPQIRKSEDIFDVWFESGSSWRAALQRRFEEPYGDEAYPADLYLEGSDQHRGWFQLSLLPAVAVTGQSPFKALLTHGFMVDKFGRKMSKSLGNTLDVEQLLKTYGADVCRWWCASLAYEDDVKVDEEFFKEAGESYRKVRNTIRFMLSNLDDFEPHQHAVALTDVAPGSLDAWALDKASELNRIVQESFQRYNFRRAHEALFNFCNDTMSATYLMAVKDRLYCDAPDSPRRRRTQTVLQQVVDRLIRLLAPFLPHTAEEAWQVVHGQQAESVHLQAFPQRGKTGRDPFSPGWQTIIGEHRDRWLKAIEDHRQGQDIDNPLDLGLGLNVSKQPAPLDDIADVDLADICGISRVDFTKSGNELEVIDLRSESRCDRCWKRDGTVTQRSDGGALCDRCAEAVGV